MTQTAVERAKIAVAAYEKLQSFEATQRLTAGPISASARVRFRRPDRIALDYSSYKDPLTEFEESLTGGPEYAPDELVGTQLSYDGQGTWLFEARQETVTYKHGRIVFAPLAGASVFAELGFLRELTRDFLLRDEGEETLYGRPAHRIGVKPKARYRSLLLKEEVFPAERATIAFDAEHSFPLRIVFFPHRHSPLFPLVGPSSPVEIQYSDVRLDQLKDGDFAFSPPAGTLVFREEVVAAEELKARLPFPLHVDALEPMHVTPYGGQALVTENDAKDKAYAQLTLVSHGGGNREEETPRSLSLRVGNYLSHNMGRRRALLSEHGEVVSLAKTQARFVDRSQLVNEQLPEAIDRQILEIGWEQNGVYWFLLGEGFTRDVLLDAAQTLASAHAEPGR